MKNKFLIIAVAVFLLVAGGFYYFSKKTPAVPGTTNEISSGVKSLKVLLNENIPQKCTFSSNDESGQTEGTSYISGGKVRTDITTTSDNKTVVSHMIFDSKTSYVWQDGEKNGFKTSFTENKIESTDEPSEETSQSNEADLNQEIDYKCSAWIPDNSLFNPPADVTFSDFSEMFKASPSTSGGSSSQCSYCNSLTGDDKNSCLSALNCK